MATLFAFASYLGTLVVLGVVCFGLGRYDPKFGVDGSFLVMAVVFAIFLLLRLLGSTSPSENRASGSGSSAGWDCHGGCGAAVSVSMRRAIFEPAGTYLIPLVAVLLAGFFSARFLETNVAAEGWRPVDV